MGGQRCPPGERRRAHREAVRVPTPRRKPNAMKRNHPGSTILVTGGAGYIGCRLVPTLAEAGYRVRVFDVMFYGDAGLDRVRSRIEVVEGDIRSVPADLLEGVSAVINLAGTLRMS